MNEFQKIVIGVLAFMGICIVITVSDDHLYPLAILPIAMPISFFVMFRKEVMIMWREVEVEEK